jgi:membrane protease YdiL (CAAX protease family)
MRSLMQRFITICMAISLILGSYLSAYSKNGGPAWAHWLGEVIMDALITIVGLILVIGSATSKEFVRKLYSLHNPNYKIRSRQRFFWIAIGLFCTLFGGYMFIYIVSQDPNCRNISC